MLQAIELIKLSKELEEGFPLEIKLVRDFYFSQIKDKKIGDDRNEQNKNCLSRR